MNQKMIRITTAEGTIAWINKDMIVSVARDNVYNKIDMSIIQLLNRTSVSMPGTPDQVMKKLFLT